MGLGRHQTVAGSGAGLISDLAYNPIRESKGTFVCECRGSQDPLRKNNLNEVKVEVAGVKLEIKKFLIKTKKPRINSEFTF